MIVRALSPSGDWTFGKGLNNYLSANACIEQNISTRLSLFLGECFFAAEQGVDWWNLLGGKNQVAINLAVNATILGNPETSGVTGILQTSVNLNRSTRELTINYKVTTVYSTITSQFQYNFPV